VTPRVPRAVIGLGSLVLSLGLLAGCATSPPAGAQRDAGAVTSDRQRDENACLRASVGFNDEDFLQLPFDIDREAYRRCMEARGHRLPLQGPGGQGDRS
jgi:hypothetical protein